MGIRVLIAEPLDFCQQAVETLRSVAEVDLRACDREELREAFKEYDVVWFRLAHRIDQHLVKPPVKCRILATPVTGLDHIDLAMCDRLGIRVVSLRGEVGFLQDIRATAEMTIGLLLALLRKIPSAAASVTNCKWQRDSFRGRELFGKTAGIIGLGRLGTIVAGYLKAFGMRVLAYDPRPDFDHAVAQRVDSLAALFAQSDVVTLHVAYDDGTRRLIGAAELAAARPGTVLINTSRGGIVDEKALIAALESGRLSGAAIDVLDGEPDIDGSHPLVAYARSHENLLITPHIGGNTVESFEKTECFLARRVVEALGQLA